MLTVATADKRCQCAQGPEGNGDCACETRAALREGGRVLLKCCSGSLVLSGATVPLRTLEYGTVLLKSTCEWICRLSAHFDDPVLVDHQVFCFKVAAQEAMGRCA